MSSSGDCNKARVLVLRGASGVTSVSFEKRRGEGKWVSSAEKSVFKGANASSMQIAQDGRSLVVVKSDGSTIEHRPSPLRARCQKHLAE